MQQGMIVEDFGGNNRRQNANNFLGDIEDIVEGENQNKKARRKNKNAENTQKAKKSKSKVSKSKAQRSKSKNKQNANPKKGKSKQRDNSNQRPPSGEVNNLKTCYYCNEPGHYANRCPKKEQQPPQNQPGHSNRNIDLSNITCYACKKTGHFANNCPTKKK